MKIRRVKTRVPDALALERLLAWRGTHGAGPHRASALAEVIWPDADWLNAQGAGAAASRVLKRLGFYWTTRGHDWGWMLSLP